MRDQFRRLALSVATSMLLAPVALADTRTSETIDYLACDGSQWSLKIATDQAFVQTNRNSGVTIRRRYAEYETVGGGCWRLQWEPEGRYFIHTNLVDGARHRDYLISYIPWDGGGVIAMPEGDGFRQYRGPDAAALAQASRGWGYMRAGLYDKAMSEVNASIQALPKMAYPRLIRSWILQQANDYSGAVSELEVAHDLAPDDPGILHQLAHAACKGGNASHYIRWHREWMLLVSYGVVSTQEQHAKSGLYRGPVDGLRTPAFEKAESEYAAQRCEN